MSGEFVKGGSRQKAEEDTVFSSLANAVFSEYAGRAAGLWRGLFVI